MTVHDVAVIGAGIVGIASTIALERLGRSVVLLDRAAGPAAAASGRNAGYLMRGAADNYARAADDFGRDTARALWKLSEANLDMLLALGAADTPGFARRPSCLVAFDEDEADDLARAAELMRDDGFDAELAEPGGPSARRLEPCIWSAGARCALINPHDAACDPAALLDRLAGSVRSPMLMNAEVASITIADDAADALRIATARGAVRARRVLLCTNAYAAELEPRLARLITPNRAQMLALDAAELPAEHRPRLSYYANRGGEYWRSPEPPSTDDATHGSGADHPPTVIVGGWRRHFADQERTAAEHVTPNLQAGLEAFAERVLGRRLPVFHRWAGTMGFTPDGLPIAGPLADLPSEPDPRPGIDPTPIAPDAADRVWLCAGFTGHGMSLGVATATLTAHALAATFPDQPASPRPATTDSPAADLADVLAPDDAERAAAAFAPARFARSAATDPTGTDATAPDPTRSLG